MGRKRAPLYFEADLKGLIIEDIWNEGVLQPKEKNNILQSIAEIIVDLPIESKFSARSFTLYPMPSRYAIKVPLSTINDAVKLLRKGRIEQKSDERIIFYGPIEKKTIKEGKLAVEE